jgi:hypothetical protein
VSPMCPEYRVTSLSGRTPGASPRRPPPTRSLARRCVGALPPPRKLRRDLAEALRAKAADRVAHLQRSFAPFRSHGDGRQRARTLEQRPPFARTQFVITGEDTRYFSERNGRRDSDNSYQSRMPSRWRLTRSRFCSSSFPRVGRSPCPDAARSPRRATPQASRAWDVRSPGHTEDSDRGCFSVTHFV